MDFNDLAKGSDQLVKFLHVPTGTRVEFPAFITEYTDTYTVSWGSEQVYGRMDPIKPYTGTTRQISIAFDVVAPRENMANYGKLIQMLYPVYSEPLKTGGAKGRTLKSPPFLRIHFMNLIANQSITNPEIGLLGCISGLGFAPNKEAGWYNDGVKLLPKIFAISFNFEPQHESELGWEGRKFLTGKFPYSQFTPEQATAMADSSNPNVALSRERDTLK